MARTARYRGVNADSLNTAPVARDDAFAMDEDKVLVIDVRLNDSDAESVTLVAAVVAPPQHGNLVSRSDGASSTRRIQISTALMASRIG